jgi:hypothetical protein
VPHEAQSLVVAGGDPGSFHRLGVLAMSKPATANDVGMWGCAACAVSIDNVWASVALTVVGILYFLASCVDAYVEGNKK